MGDFSLFPPAIYPLLIQFVNSNQNESIYIQKQTNVYMLNKRGLNNVLASFLVVVVAIAAVFIIWPSFNPSISNTGSGFQTEFATLLDSLSKNDSKEENKPFEFTNTGWSGETTKKGGTVTLTIGCINCENESINFEVWEDLSVDELIEEVRGSAVVVDGMASVTWTVPNDLRVGLNIYFKASSGRFPNKIIASSPIPVEEQRRFGSCGDGRITGAEVCDGDNLGVYGDGIGQCSIYNSQLFSAGHLKCSSDCRSVNTSLCVSGALQADFKVFKLVSVDPVDGAEEWVEINLESEEIELGLRVKFDASTSTRAAFYDWDFWDGGGGGDVDIIRGVNSAGPREATLTVWDSSGFRSETITKTIYIDEGVQLLSKMPSSGTFFRPTFYALLGSDVWAISSFKQIGTASLADPYNLPAMTVLSEFGSFNRARGMAACTGKVYIANGQDGVDIYRADPNDFTLLSTLTLEELNTTWAGGVACVTDTLYVMAFPSQLLVYDVSDAFQPLRVNTVPITGEFSKLYQLNDQAIATPDFSVPKVTILDIRDPLNPEVLEDLIELQAGLSADTMIVSESQVGVRTGEGFVLTDLLIPDAVSEPISVRTQRLLVLTSNRMAFNNKRLYMYSVGMEKYDILHPGEQENFMQRFEPPGNGVSRIFLLDPDGPDGPLDQVLFVGFDQFGFAAYKP